MSNGVRAILSSSAAVARRAAAPGSPSVADPPHEVHVQASGFSASAAKVIVVVVPQAPQTYMTCLRSEKTIPSSLAKLRLLRLEPLSD